MLSNKPRLILADDHEEMLVETTRLLEKDFDIVAVARDGFELVSAVRTLKPDVVVTDAKMPRLNGLEASREIRRRHLCEAIVLLTVHTEPELVSAALDSGICGFVFKVNAGEELIPAVHAALDGRTFVSRHRSE